MSLKSGLNNGKNGFKGFLKSKTMTLEFGPSSLMLLYLIMIDCTVLGIRQLVTTELCTIFAKWA